MNMKRSVLLSICVLLPIAIIIAGFRSVLLPPTPCPVNVRLETCKQLKPGMSNDAVEAILGGPAGDYRTRKDIGYLYNASGAGSFPGQRSPGRIMKEWLTNEYGIEVEFGSDGKVEEVRVGAALRIPSWPERLLHSVLQRFR